MQDKPATTLDGHRVFYPRTWNKRRMPWKSARTGPRRGTVPDGISLHQPQHTAERDEQFEAYRKRRRIEAPARDLRTLDLGETNLFRTCNCRRR